MNILLAEDDDDHAKLLAFLLQKVGFVVKRVEDGLKAYELIKSGPPPDLLITDIMMPGMSGFDLLMKLNSEKIEIPTIVLTAKESEEDVLRGFSCGALDYIRKPFRPSEVVARINTALKKMGH